MEGLTLSVALSSRRAPRMDSIMHICIHACVRARMHASCVMHASCHALRSCAATGWTAQHCDYASAFNTEVSDPQTPHLQVNMQGEIRPGYVYGTWPTARTWCSETPVLAVGNFFHALLSCCWRVCPGHFHQSVR